MGDGAKSQRRQRPHCGPCGVGAGGPLRCAREWGTWLHLVGTTGTDTSAVARWGGATTAPRDEHESCWSRLARRARRLARAGQGAHRSRV